MPPRRERLLLIRPPLPFGFTVASKGQAETFVFHYKVQGGICRGRRRRRSGCLQGREGAGGESGRNEVVSVRRMRSEVATSRGGGNMKLVNRI